VFKKTHLQQALSYTGGITTSGEFPEEAHAVEEKLGDLGELDRRIAHTN
jgi:hypothetical protein